MRKNIAIYDKLKVGVCILEKYDKDITRMLKKKKYTFSKLTTQKLKLVAYNINVDSIEEACKLKKRIHKICQ